MRHYITVPGVIRIRLIVQVWVLACFNWSGLISIALTMVPCFSYYQITGCKANNSAITCRNSSFSNRGICMQVNILSQSNACAWIFFICRRLLVENAYFQIRSVCAWFFPWGSLLFAFRIKFRNLWSSNRCLRNGFQVSLCYKKTMAYPMITDMGDFSFLAAKSSNSLWFLIVLAFNKDFQESRSSGLISKLSSSEQGIIQVSKWARLVRSVGIK